MNQKERLRLKEVLRQLERGPGNGWKEALEGSRDFSRTIEEREASLRLWLSSWIVPPIADVVDRYTPDKTRAASTKKIPATHYPEHFIKVSGKDGGYVDREGSVTLDKAKAYRWGSRDGALTYITDNLARLGSMTLEEAPKRG